MHHESVTAAADPSTEAREARCGDAAHLARALAAARADTLATFAAFERALPDLVVPRRDELNPPLWELGHVGWFQERWLHRHPQRHRGIAADPQAPRLPPRRACTHADADALYDSSHVPHATRWSLPLPDARTTRTDLAAQLDDTLSLLAALHDDPPDDAALYFFRLALLHEDMHHEAALYMAQALGVAIDDPRWQPRSLPAAGVPLSFEARRWRLGSESGDGFAFDNELKAHETALPPAQIDSQVLRWAEFLPFVEDGGYSERRWWSDAGWAWREQTATSAPAVLQRGSTWQRRIHGRWEPLDSSQAACHLSWHEAQAWCRWAARRLPTEAEWEHAAITRPDAFAWGEVWEWTSSPFMPYPGFEPHPYRDYSVPWFDGRPVLRGASFMTQPRMRHPRYRNYFQAHRRDVATGFRTCLP